MNRGFLLAALTLVLALAGCIAADDALDATNQPDASSAPLDLDMDNANVQEATPERIVFAWSDQAPANENLANAPAIASSFEVPSQEAFTAHATLTAMGDAPLSFTLDKENVATLCSASSDAEATCSVPALGQEGDAWTARVQQTEINQEPVDFTLTLTLRLEDPQQVPDAPTLVPAPTQAPAEPSWPDKDDAPIRPGVNIASGSCTGNFLFATPDYENLYMGTAAHCITDTDLGDDVGLANDRVTGTLAYCSWGASENLLTCPNKGSQDDGWADDFALVEIPKDHHDDAHPSMLVWGGPTELEDPPAEGTEVYTYGNSDMRDGGQDLMILDPRPGVVTSSSESTTQTLFTGSSIWGDSGSPVVTADGATVGTMQTLGIVPPGGNGVSNLSNSLANYEQDTGGTIELATWEIFDPPEFDDPLPPLTGS